VNAKTSRFDEMMNDAAFFEQNGAPDRATALRDQALKLMPKYKADNGYAINPATKKLEFWSTSEQTGKPEFQGVAPKPDMVLENLGGTTRAIDKNALTNGDQFTRTQDPNSVASNALGWSRFNFDKGQANKPTIQNIPGVGMLAVDPRTKTAMPITMGGKPVIEDKPLTESQGKAAGFAARMAAAEKIMQNEDLSKNQKPEYLPTALRSLPFGIGEASGNQMETAPRQQVRQAQEDWVRSALRLESGAVIGADEMAQEIRTFFPQLGDSDDVITQKADARKLKQSGIARQGGPGHKAGGTVDFSQLRK
jgi:hypothetical protein